MINLKKLTKTLAILISLLTVAASVWALSMASSKALDAFRRYEPDFRRSLQSLQDFARKAHQQKLEATDKKWFAIKEEADETMEFVQKRFDLLDDLYKSTLNDNPGDRAALMDGFSRIEDLYRRCRDLHVEKFQEGGALLNGAADSTEPAPVDLTKTEYEKPVATGETAAKTEVPATSEPAKPETTTTEGTELKPVPPTPVTVAPESSSTAKPEPKEEQKVRLHGTFKADLRNRNEKYTATNRVLPSNFNQFKLSLSYQADEKNKLSLDNKYIHRKRNELVKENILTFAWLHVHSKEMAWSLKDTLHHVWYPQATVKEYRDNLIEGFLNLKEKRWERTYNLGFDRRVYPNYSRSDYKQWNLGGQTTRFIPNGTVFWDSIYNGRNYDNSPSLDYTNQYYNLEYNQSFNGNDSEVSVSNTYDTRHYGNEAVNLFRANYWDNYFRFRYELPVNKKWTWIFEDDYQKRLYASDFSRGYSQFNAKTTAKITIDKQTRARFWHNYTMNHENTTARAHRNHKFNGMWEKKFSDSFKLKLEDTFHHRTAITGATLDFHENVFNAKATWKLPSKIELVWNNEYLTRYYEALFYRDYRYFATGLAATYAKAKQFEWQLGYQHRTFSFRNGNNLATGWNSNAQPLAEAKYTKYINKDLKAYVASSYEKTFYKTFDTLSQELLWDFTRPLTITEFTGGLEYSF
ncbi:MAG TPA: hypothetical protein PKO06_03395 [Candidatus Ozemobacteraceae bacterium]|nr:hypothetical protein [Candidatus Ozemobacteraceae bacterium]